MNRFRIINMLGMLVTLASLAFAQAPDAPVKLRLAQSLEQAGDWERAVPIYESLFLSDPGNFVYFEALRRGYTQLKEYEKAIDLIKYRLTTQRNEPVLLSTLGGIYYQMGDERKADSVWQSIIKNGAQNPNLYRLVASQMMEFRLYDRAIQMFLEARKATGDGELFSDELAGLYGAFQQYEEATREYLRMLSSKPLQLSYIQSRMSSFFNHPEALTVVRRVIGDEAARRGEFVPLRQLYAWVLMEAKDYESAFNEERVIDKLTRASGQELFNFAQRAAQEQAYRTAATAFQEVLSGNPKKEIIPYARLGYARAVEESVARPDTSSLGSAQGSLPSWPVSEAQPAYDRALDLYQAIIRDFPRTEFAAQASFRIGVIRNDRLFDLDGALAAFAQVRALVPAHPLAVEATISIGEVLTAKNDLPGAAGEYRMLLASGNSMIRDRARFRVAELDYFQAHFDSSEAALVQLTQNPSADLANDALQLLYFIEENKPGSAAALTDFARADLLMWQRKLSEAQALFSAVIKQYPLAMLVDDATMRIGELSVRLGRPQDALRTFQSIVDDMPASILRDRAQLRIAQVYESVVRDSAKAIEAYETLLTKFPHSLYIEQARKRIRILRGDNI